MVKVPVEVVVVLRVRLEPVFLTVTSAPCTTAPLESVTVPLNEPAGGRKEIYLPVTVWCTGGDIDVVRGGVGIDAQACPGRFDR